MQRLEVSGAVRPIYGSLGVKWLTYPEWDTSLVSSPLCGCFGKAWKIWRF